jgi:hypothetical protein
MWNERALPSRSTSEKTASFFGAGTLLSAEEAKDRLREIVEGFFFRRLTGEDGKRVGGLLFKSPWARRPMVC